MIEISRKTKETDIAMSFDYGMDAEIGIQIPLPFFSHLLESCFHHGGFSVNLRGSGDVEVDPHHLVEDLGIVMGSCIEKWREMHKVSRFGHAVIPMDDALVEVAIDACGRSALIYKLQFPQSHAGDFQLTLVREFFVALSNNAGINLYITSREGLNGHHVAEAAFKAFGRALSQALMPCETLRSTKGLL